MGDIINVDDEDLNLKNVSKADMESISKRTINDNNKNSNKLLLSTNTKNIAKSSSSHELFKFNKNDKIKLKNRDSLSLASTPTSEVFVSLCLNDNDDSDDYFPHNRYGLDLITGHLVLSYMESYLLDPSKLDKEWAELCSYEPDSVDVSDAVTKENIRKNKHSHILPYNYNRFKLNKRPNINNCDYINASKIIDHDPKNPLYIFTQDPLPHTVADFWQLVWESGSSAIINLTPLSIITDQSNCHPYWPDSGVEIYHKFEVHLISQHVCNPNFVIRNFFLRNNQQQQSQQQQQQCFSNNNHNELSTEQLPQQQQVTSTQQLQIKDQQPQRQQQQQQKSEARIITQYHYLTWTTNCVPKSIGSFLKFRRKVNKYCRGNVNPLVIHCNDGSGSTGTYALIDNVLNRIYNGTKELDISATLEFLRDQRVQVVATKDQYEFVLSCVAQSIRIDL